MNFLVDIILFHARICIICNSKNVWFLLTNTLVGVFVFLVRFEEFQWVFMVFMVRLKNKPNLKPVLLSDYLTKGGMLWVQYQPISGNHIKHVRSGFHLRSWIFMKSFLIKYKLANVQTSLFEYSDRNFKVALIITQTP